MRNRVWGIAVPMHPSQTFAEQYPAVTRDNQWLAFTSNQTGRDEVYVRRLAGGGDQIQVSVGGGSEPVWSPDGRELFFRGVPNAATGTEAMIFAVKISTRPTLSVTSREALFSASAIVTANPHANYDVSPDGKRFVYVRSNPSSASFGDYRDLFWAADDRSLIALEYPESGFDTRLIRIPANGGAPSYILREGQATFWDHHPSPDGRYTLVPVEVAQGSTLWRVDLKAAEAAYKQRRRNH